MKIDTRAPSNAGSFRGPTGAADTESTRAFDQLLRSMEQEMWNGAAQSDRPTRGTEPSVARSGASKPDRMAPADASATAPFEPALPETHQDTARNNGSTRSLSAATRSPLAGSHSRIRFDGSPGTLAPSIDVLPVEPADQRIGTKTPVSDESARESPPLPANRSIPTRQSASETPFRLTVSGNDTEVTIALRTRMTSSDDLESIEAHARQALRQYGLRSARLLVNGIDRNLTISGEHPHGD